MEKRICSISKKQIVKNVFIILFTLFLTAYFTKSYALPFNITPNGALPTSVVIGSSVTASYLVTNKTGSQRNNNFVKYLPRNVSVGAGGCGTNFNLAPNGRAGDTCVLNLTVTGAVNSADSDSRNHLFVCFPGGTVCAGTLFPLNVIVVPVPTPVPVPVPTPVLTSISITPINATITVGETSQQYTAIGSYSNGSTVNITSSVTWSSSNPQFATISQSGLATSVSEGTSTIQAVLGSITSNSANLTILQHYAYITNFNTSNISFCPINADGSFGTCNITGSGSTPLPAGITINSTGTLAYVALNGFGLNGGVLFCPINSDHSLGTCTDATTGGSGLSGNLRGIVLNSSNDIAYVTRRSPSSTVFFCPINPNGTLGACTATGNGFTVADTTAINPQGTKAYVAQQTAPAANAVSICTIDQTDGSFVPASCISAGMNIGGNSFGITLNNAGSFAYVVNINTIVSLCPINQTTGSFGGQCTATAAGVTPSFGIALDNTNKFAYIISSNLVAYCAINQQNGDLESCNTTGNGLDGPYGIAIS